MSDLRYANAPASFDAEKAAESFSSARPTNDLRGTAAPIESGMGSTGKIIGALAIGAVVVGIGAYTYANGMWTAPQQQNERVASNDLPAPPALPPKPAMLPTTTPPDVTPPVLDTPAQQTQAPQTKTARVTSSKPVTKPAAAESVPAPQTQMTAPVPPETATPAQTLPPQSALTPPPTLTPTETQEPPATTPEQTPQTPQQPQ